MDENFLPTASESTSTDVSPPAPPSPSSGKEFVKILVVGSRQGIDNVIKALHRLGFAEVGQWSPPMPYGESGEMMSVLRKRVDTK